MIFEVVKVKYKQFYNDMWYAKCMGFHSELTLSLRMQSNLYSLQINTCKDVFCTMLEFNPLTLERNGTLKIKED